MVLRRSDAPTAPAATRGAFFAPSTPCSALGRKLNRGTEQPKLRLLTFTFWGKAVKPQPTPIDNHLWKPSAAMSRAIALAAFLNAGLALAWTLYH